MVIWVYIFLIKHTITILMNKKLIAEYEKNNPEKDRPGVRKFFK